MARFKHGDIFTFKLPNDQFICGRVQLDVTRQCIRPKLLKPDSPLHFSGGSVLVEIYKELSSSPTYARSEILIPGVFVDPGRLQSGEWQIGGHEPVDPTQVEFPEAVMVHDMQGLFIRGEVALPLPLDATEVEQINVYPSVSSSEVVPDTCLHYLGLKDLIDPEFRDTSDLSNSDLRFTGHRGRIYRMLGQDQGQSYYQMSTRLGHDITRFYK